MRDYKNILYVGHGGAIETAALKQAVSLARNNDATLSALLVCPKFPKDFPDFRATYEDAIRTQAAEAIQSLGQELGWADGAADASIDLIEDKAPSIGIIQHVLRHGCDLVVKAAEEGPGSGGFQALDMHLLRKCPSAVWLSRPIDKPREQINVAVAVDPESDDPVADLLSKRLLGVSDSLSNTCSDVLHVVSCWDYELEAYLSGNTFVKVSDQELKAIVHKARQDHRALLDGLIAGAKIAQGYHLNHLRGPAAEQIPAYVGEHDIDILVMGTVARTGIPGFIIGNTAENIFRTLPCSLLALKPDGFVSPVKAY